MRKERRYVSKKIWKEGKEGGRDIPTTKIWHAFSVSDVFPNC